MTQSEKNKFKKSKKKKNQTSSDEEEDDSDNNDNESETKEVISDEEEDDDENDEDSDENSDEDSTEQEYEKKEYKFKQKNKKLDKAFQKEMNKLMDDYQYHHPIINVEFYNTLVEKMELNNNSKNQKNELNVLEKKLCEVLKAKAVELTVEQQTRLLTSIVFSKVYSKHLKRQVNVGVSYEIYEERFYPSRE